MNSIIPIPIRAVRELFSLSVPLYKLHYFDDATCRYVPLDGLFDYSEFLAFKYVYGLTLIRTPFFNKHFSNSI